MKSRILPVMVCAALASCTSYRIPSLEVALNSPSATVRGDRVDMRKITPLLKRATWSSDRQAFSVWKVWDEVRMGNGTVLRIVNQGPRFSSFRILGVDGEYYIRSEDLAAFDAAWRAR